MHVPPRLPCRRALTGTAGALRRAATGPHPGRRCTRRRAPVPTTLSGTLSQDDDVAWFDLRLDSADPFRLGTTSYAAGGFAPILALFTASGELLMLDVGSSHVCGSAGAGAADASSGFAGTPRSLPARRRATIKVALSQDGNAPLGPWLSDGFQQTGRPDYTGQDWLGQAGLQFIQIDGQQRNSAWKLNVEGVAVVPEPSAGALPRRFASVAPPLALRPGAPHPFLVGDPCMNRFSTPIRRLRQPSQLRGLHRSLDFAVAHRPSSRSRRTPERRHPHQHRTAPPTTSGRSQHSTSAPVPLPCCALT